MKNTTLFQKMITFSLFVFIATSLLKADADNDAKISNLAKQYQIIKKEYLQTKEDIQAIQTVLLTLRKSPDWTNELSKEMTLLEQMQWKLQKANEGRKISLEEIRVKASQ